WIHRQQETGGSCAAIRISNREGDGGDAELIRGGTKGDTAAAAAAAKNQVGQQSRVGGSAREDQIGGWSLHVPNRNKDNSATGRIFIHGLIWEAGNCRQIVYREHVKEEGAAGGRGSVAHVDCNRGRSELISRRSDGHG